MFSHHPKCIERKKETPSPLTPRICLCEKSIIQKAVTQLQQSPAMLLAATLGLLLTTWDDKAERE